MTGADARRIVVVLEPGAGPIAGSVEDPDGEPRRFAGWLELCALLEEERAAGQERAAQGDTGRQC